MLLHFYLFLDLSEIYIKTGAHNRQGINGKRDLLMQNKRNKEKSGNLD
jgi:hypothetical protein